MFPQYDTTAAGNLMMRTPLFHVPAILILAGMTIAGLALPSCASDELHREIVADDRISTDGTGSPSTSHQAPPAMDNPDIKTDTATFAAGCFWCVEALFQQLEGVISVEPGYSGGKRPNPTYEQVCTGTTGHAEVCTIVFDPKSISYTDLLEAFFSSHDPTTLNRQGADVGTQYRSAIFYHNDEQHELAARYKADLDRSGTFPDPIVTEIKPFTVTYPAEEYHRDYFDRNPRQTYCQYVIRPKLDKFTKQFKSRLKK